ncbi:hypothetical protein [Methanimicrococcus stummii]|nr:hypothetical protein [Methanimicrococcus sp. Es2]
MHETEDFYELILNGEVDAFFELIRSFNMDFGTLKGMFLFGGIYDNMTPEGHEKMMAYDIGQTENEDAKKFVEDYRNWFENKDDVAYYVKKAHDSMNIEQNMSAAQYYIQKGLEIDSKNTPLKLYEIYIFLNYAEDEEGNPLIKAYLEIIDMMIENGIDRSELVAFARYLKAAAYYRLEEKEKSKTEMKKAIELMPEYQAVYEDYFGKND